MAFTHYLSNTYRNTTILRCGNNYCFTKLRYMPKQIVDSNEGRFLTFFPICPTHLKTFNIFRLVKSVVGTEIEKFIFVNKTYAVLVPNSNGSAWMTFHSCTKNTHCCILLTEKH